MLVVGIPVKLATDSRLGFIAKGLALFLEGNDVAGDIEDDFIQAIGQITNEELKRATEQLKEAGWAFQSGDGTVLTLWPESSINAIIATDTHAPKNKIVAKSIPHKLRLCVLVRDEFKCRYCRNHTYMIDHLIPRSRGGENVVENLVSCCLSCNSKKGARTPEEAGMVLLSTYGGY